MSLFCKIGLHRWRKILDNQLISIQDVYFECNRCHKKEIIAYSLFGDFVIGTWDYKDDKPERV